MKCVHEACTKDAIAIVTVNNGPQMPLCHEHGFALQVAQVPPTQVTIQEIPK